MKSKFAPGGYSVYEFLCGRSYKYLVRFLLIICFCMMGMQGAKAQGFGVSYSYSTTDIVRIDNATGALTNIFTFAPGTITSATALAVDLNGDIYFTSDQVAGSTLLKFVPNPAPATGGVLSTIGTITPTINDGGTPRNLVFGKLAMSPSGQLFTISNYSGTNTGNLANRPYLVNISKTTATVTAASRISLPTGGLTDLPTSGGDADFSPVGRLFVSGSVIGAPSVPSVWEINPSTGAILGYKSVSQPPGATFTNLSGIGFDLQGNAVFTATLNSYIIQIAAIEFSGSVSWSGAGVINAGSVTVLDGPLVSAYGDIGSNAFKILGHVFEDVNYGGGAGRPFGTAGTAGMPNVRVEVYDASGNMQNFTNTLSDGSYVLGVSGNGVFYVRMVNGSGNSTRPGSNGSELGVQTFRTESPVLGTLVNIVNEVGGRSPATVDPGIGTIGSTVMTPGSFILSGGGLNGTAASVSQASIGAANVAGIDFGLNFSTIVNTNNTGQGSLKQFINNSNTLTNAGLDQVANSIFDPAPGVETSIFMIPDGASHPGINKSSQLTVSGAGMTAIINIQNLLPQITDAFTSIDGRTQTANIGNSQPGIAGHPGTTVGVDQIALPGVQRPEVELLWGGLAGTAPGGFTISGQNTTIRSIAIHGFGVNGSTASLVNTGNILITGSSNTFITESIIGGAASSTNAETVGTNPSANILVQGGSTDLTITNNLILRADFGGIYKDGLIDSGQVSLTIPLAVTNLVVSGNEILNNGLQTSSGTLLISAGIELDNAGPTPPIIPSNYTFTNNLITGNAQQGIQLDYAGTVNITNNSFLGNGTWPNPGPAQLTQLDNVFLYSCSDVTVRKNIITGNPAAGVIVLNAPAVRNRITQNSIYNNAGLGIVLGNYPNPEAVIPNDNGDADTGPNTLLNFPVVTNATIVGNNLVLKGFSGPGTTIELFVADRDSRFSPTPPLSPNPLPAAFTNRLGFGEGHTYLLTLQEGGTVGGINDEDNTTGTYTDDGTGVIGNRTENRFQFTIPLSSLPGISFNSLLTATATDAVGNTSEFNGVVPVAARSVDLSVTKADDPDPVIAGQTLTYTITVSNAEVSSAILTTDTIHVLDTLPAGFIATSYTPSAGTYNSTTGAWTGVSIPAEGSVRLTIVGTVAANATGTLTNNVAVTVPAGLVDPTPGNNRATQITTINRSVGLTLTKTGSPKPVIAGQTLTYTITLGNNAPSSIVTGDTIKLTDNLPIGFTANSFTPSAGTYNSNTGAWTGLSLATGQSVTLTITGTVNPAASGVLTNTATAIPPAGVADRTPLIAIDVTPISRVVDLALTKTASPKPAIAGQTLTYTIILTNNGPSTIVAGDTTRLTDNLPAGFTATTFTPSAGTYNSATGAWSGITLASGQSATLVIAGTVNGNATGILTNTVTAAPPTGTTDPTPATATDLTPVNRSVVLLLAKTASPKPAVAGQGLTYTITLTNAGPSAIVPADVTTLTDNLPAGFTAVTFTPSAGTYNSVTGTWTGLTLATGQSVTLTIAGTVSATASGTLTNTATATPPAGVVNPIPVTATDITAISRVIDLNLAKTASPKPAVAGQGLTYTITLTNNGPSTIVPADISTITDNLPAGFTATSYTASAGNYTSGTGAWTGLTLTTGQSVTLTITGTVSATASGSLTNTVTAAPPAGSIDPTPATATDVTVISRIIDLSLSKTASPKPATVGQGLTYTITLTNNGPSTIVPVDVTTVTDNLPAGFTAISYTTSAGIYSSGTGAWTGITLATGQSVTLTIGGIISASASGNLINTVTATPPPGSTDPTPATATDITPISRIIDLSLTKTANPKPAVAGQGLTYTITLTNNGPGTILPVDVTTITDNLPAGFTATSYTASAGTYTSGTGAWTGITLVTGQSVTLTIAGTVNAAATGTLINTVTATPPVGSTDPTPATATDITPINRIVDLSLTKTASPKPVVAGQPLTYTITLTNSGPSSIVAGDTTRLTDNLPAGFTATSYTASAGIYNSATGGWRGLTLASGQSATLTITGVVSASAIGSLTNTVTAAPPTGTTDPTPATATDVTLINRIIDLNLTKTASPKPASAGQALTYTITLTNNGPSAIVPADVTNVTDVLPAGFTATTFTVSAGSYNSGSGAWTGLTLASGQSVVLTIAGTVNSNARGSLTNTVTATPPPGSTDPTPATATDVTDIRNVADLSVTKTDGSTTYTPGTNVVYTIVVSNAGPSDVVGANVNDLLPAGITVANWTVTPGAGAVVPANSGTGAIHQLVSIPAGSSITYMLTLSVPSGFTGILSNTATVAVPDDYTDNNPANNTATDNDTYNPSYGLSAIKTAPASVSAGTAIQYTITFTNNGPSDLTGAAITDNIPASITGVTWTAAVTGTATVSATSGTGNAVSLTGALPAGPGNQIVLTVKGTVRSSATGIITNQAAITAPDKPAFLSNTTNTTVLNTAGLSVVKTGPLSGTVSAGNTITYNILVTNAGPSDAVNAVIADAVPAVITGVTWTATAGGTATINGGSPMQGTGNAINFTATIPAGTGNQVSITVTGTIPSSTPVSGITNTATVTPPGEAPVSGQAQTNITNDPGLVITKTGPATLSAGDNISYTIQVVNNGPSDAVAAVIADNIPVQVLNASWIASSAGSAAVTSGATGAGNTINVTGNIPAGAANMITIVVTGKVDPSVRGIIRNTATVTPANKPVQSSNEVITAIVNNPVLNISKAGPATMSAGQLITYTLTLTNAGPSNVTGAQITDALPAHISNIVVNTTVSGNALVTANTVTGNTIHVTGNVAGGAGNSIIVTVSGLVDPSFTGQFTNIAVANAPDKPEVPSNPVTTTVTNTPGIKISKSGPASINAGQPIAYTIVVTNNGPSDATNVAIADNLPAVIHGAVWTATTSGNGTVVSAASGTGNINITGTLPAGAANAITIQVTGITDPAFSGTVTNTAIAAAPGTTPDSSTVNTSVTNNPEMHITKSGPASISAGQPITYTVQVTNTGFSDAVNATITDNIPAGIKAITWSAVTNGNGTTVSAANGTGNVNITGNIPAGAGNSILITINGTVDPAFTGDSLKNTATTMAPGKPPVSSNTVTSIVTIDPTINVVKSGPDRLSAGAPITYTIDVTNSGPSNAVNVAIADILPVGLQHITWTATTTGAGTTVSNTTGAGNVNITGNIPAGVANKITITLNATVDPAYVGILTNNVTATVPGKTPVSSRKNTLVTNDPNIQVIKTGPSVIVVGQPVTYNITLTNNGPSNATNVSIVDLMPAGLQNVNWTATVTGPGTTVSSPAGNGSINITGNIPAGAANVINITVTGLLSPDFSGTTLVNTVTAVLPGKQPQSSTTTAAVQIVSDLEIQKSGPQQIVPGENVTYTILVTNNGPSNAVNAVINDVVPAALQNVSWTAATNGVGTTVSAVNGTGNNIALTGNIPAGVANSITIVVTGKLDPATMLSQISNTATATPAAGTIDPTPASSTVISTISRETDLVIVKSGPANKGAGQAITYQLVVTNNGPSDVTGAIIQDVVPAQITGVAYTTSITGSAFVTTAALTGNILHITGNIAAGAGNSIIIQVNGVINPNTAPGNITNTATVAPPAGTTETQPGSNTSSVTTAVSTNVGLLISKSGPAIANTGDSITYTIELSNTGATNATHVVIADSVPPEITGVTWTAAATGHGATTITATSGTGNNIAFNADIEGTTSGPGLVTITVKGVVSPQSGTAIVNTATATFDGVIHSTVTTAINNAADLRIVKTGPDSIAAGQVITYMLDVTNAGPASVLNAVISDQVPAQVHNVTWTATASGGANVPVATGAGNLLNIHADIPAKTGHVSVTITGQIDAAYVGMLTNTATATPPAGNPDPTPATSTVHTTVLNEPVLQVVKSGPATIAAGQQIVYTVVVTNTGASDATNVLVTDIIPATVKNPAWTASANGAGATISNGNSGTGNHVNVTGNLLAGITGEIRITVTGIVDSSFIGSITNMASATPQGGTTVNSAPVITNVTNKATLHIVKSGPATIAAGQNITYSLIVTNSGPSNAAVMTIDDVVPAAIQSVTWNAITAGTGAIITGGNSGTGNNIHITGSLQAGADSIRVMITGIVNPAFKGLLTNTAMAGTDGAIPDSSTVQTQVTNSPGIHVDKSGPEVVNAGAPIIYTIDVTNAGPSDAANVSVNDLVPTPIQHVTWTATAAGSGTNITGANSGTGNTISLTANIAAGTGNKISITVNGIVDPSFIGDISNIANAIVPGDTPVVSIPVVTHVNNTPALHITKSGPATALSNDSITYIITVSNTGPSEAIGAVITDAIPVAILHPNWSAATTGSAVITAGAVGTGTNVSVTANIPAGAANVVTITVRGRIAPDYNGMLKNIAVVTPPGKPPVKTDTTITHVKRAADIRIVKSGPGQVAAGGNITYTIDVTNAGPATADSVTITDMVPADITVNNWNAAMISGAGTIHGPSTGTGNQISLLASLANAAHMRITITGMVAQQAASPLINTAKAVLPPGIVDPTPEDTSTVVTTVVQQPGVQLRKTGPDTAHAGEIIHYTITATNMGPSDAAGMVIKDMVPALLQQVSWNATTTGNASIITGATGTGNNVLLTGNIAAGNNNAIRIMITGKIPADYAGGLSNIATATVPNDTGVIKTPPVTTNVTKEADLWITKSGPATIIQGKTIIYSITVGNKGPATVHKATIQDILPAGMDSVAATVISQSGGATGTVLTVNNSTVNGMIDSIPAGGLVNIEIKGRVTGIATLNNKATVIPPADVKDPVPGNNTTPLVVTTVIPISKLSITKTVSPDAPYGIGQTVTYTLHIKNEGPGEINPVQVTDVMSGTPTDAPVLGTPEIGTATYNAAARTIVWNAGLMTNGQSATLSYKVTLLTAGSINNVAIIKGPVDISIPDTAHVTIPVGSYTDLGITKTGPATIIQGQIITYEIVVTNLGASAANGAVIHDAVPAGIGNVTASVAVQSGGAANTVLTMNGNDLRGTIGVFPAGATVTIAVKGLVNSAGTLSNVAHIVTPPGVVDTIPRNDSTPPVITVITPTAKLRILKTVAPAADTYSPGEKVTYTLKVTNTGPGKATGVIVTDVMDSHIVSLPTLGTPGTGVATFNPVTKTITWSIGTMANGESTSLSYEVTLLDTGLVKNIAIVKGTRDIVIPDSTQHVITVGRSADLIVHKKIITAAPYTIGQQVDYSVDITNAGPNNASGITVTDILPVGALATPSHIIVSKGQAVYDPASNTILWTMDSLHTGEIATLTFHTELTATGDVTNKAVISGKEPDPDLSSNTAIVVINVGGDVFIPNTITPNGDGKNDRFVIQGLSKYPGSSLFIYNRWGNMVYQSRNYDNSWSGEGLNEGTYYYILKLNAPQGERAYKGWIELLR